MPYVAAVVATLVSYMQELSQDLHGCMSAMWAMEKRRAWNFAYAATSKPNVPVTSTPQYSTATALLVCPP
jgi:hypothetical protein